MRPLYLTGGGADAPALVLAIHGILTRLTPVSWPDRFDAYLGRDANVLKCEYAAGPFPVWNHFVRNRRLAEARANEIELHCRSRVGSYRVGIVAHSNGCDIAIRTVRELARRGIPTDAIVLTGSVTSPDVKGSGILELLESGALARAYAYCNGSDLPLRLPFAWPYSDLGRRGWQDVPESVFTRVVTRWFPGYGHSGYFSPANREKTFELMRADLEIPRRCA